MQKRSGTAQNFVLGWMMGGVENLWVRISGQLSTGNFVVFATEKYQFLIIHYSRSYSVKVMSSVVKINGRLSRVADHNSPLQPQEN